MMNSTTPSPQRAPARLLRQLRGSLGNQAFGRVIQAKLQISQPGDEYEQEADRVADQVMRMPDPATPAVVRPEGPPQISRLQRKCAQCEEEQIQRQPMDEEMREEEALPFQAKEVAGQTPQVTPAVKAQVDELRGGGQPLPESARAFFEPRFGRDFSLVRIHTDGQAAESTRAVNALAYTVGNHVVFGAGKYSPSGDDGRRLLAHELAHVTQAGAATTIRRAASDYEIGDLPANAASDTSQIFFERGSSTIPASETSKITALASPAGQNLTLHGFSSEDAPAAARLVRVTDRLNAVETALAAAGHTGTRAKVTHPNEGVGDIDYRHRRSVQVLPTPIGLLSAPTTVNPCGAPGSEVASGTPLTNCESSFTGAHPTARAVVDAAERDIVTTPTAAANALVTRFFSGVPRADVNANVTAIAKQVRQLPARHRCHTSCDGGCGRPAYNTGRGLGATGAMMTLCPSFVTASLPFRIEVLIHEASHGNPVEAVDDIAYSNTRLIPFLLPADSRRNTDSYVLLMRLVHTAGSMAVGPATPDTLSGMTGVGPGSDTEQTQRAVAWLESWLNYGDFDTETLYTTITASLAAGAWVTTGSNEFNIQTMHRLATVFTPDLTDPGADGSPRTTPPVESDKIRIAAIHDRFDQMYDSVNHKALTVTRGATESWGSQVAIPHLTQAVSVKASFFGLSQVEQVKHLVRLMARARSDISAGFEEKYVKALDLIHTHRRLGP